MPVNADFLELGGEAINALVETNTGEKVVGKVANPDLSNGSSSSSSDGGSRRPSRKDPRRDSVHDGRRTRTTKDEKEGKWSAKSFFRSSRHQQKPRESQKDHKPQKSKPNSKTKTADKNKGREQQDAESRLEQRRERFRAAKTSYIPPENIQPAEKMQFKQERLYAEVEMAVAAAKRRSEDVGRDK
ncbi:hypothetical protein CERZMDRAFT_102628 [Cercospora zeae-maydis SCOH1-5]|uniref:Uncharacterized protein n=1 Tax=Cercospora zeae-maydis SCOH1-5 TaxID=717836 RepID=A0A6A6F1L5_9PEZI|nr:hypothetical protein CERZMDRAFT_102628 [Cercospora zeae-maydis SCOH1-5]